MHAGQPLAPPRGHRSAGNLLFSGSFLVTGVCSRCVVQRDDRDTCKRGSLVPADKRMLRVTVVQLTLGFSEVIRLDVDTLLAMKSNLVWSGVSCDCWCGDAALATLNTFYIISCFFGS